MTQEPEIERLSCDEWKTTPETGVNPRTLQRFLRNGWVEKEIRANRKRRDMIGYWRRKCEDCSETPAQGIR